MTSGGSSGFDDRPTVAAGTGDEVWAGWSHGTKDASCDLIGTDDQVRVALSGDGGRSFGPGIPIDEPGANFGVQIAPTGPGSADVAWAQTRPSGTFKIFLAHIRSAHLEGPPTVVGAGTALPSQLPGAGFPSFTVPTMVLTNGRPALAWSAWVAGHAVIQLALPAPSGPGWLRRTIAATPGEDDLLPALGGDANAGVVLLNATYRRINAAVSYQVRRVAIAPESDAIVLGRPHTVAAGLPGPGFREVGESLEISEAAGTSATAVVTGGQRVSRIWSATWAP